MLGDTTGADDSSFGFSSSLGASSLSASEDAGVGASASGVSVGFSAVSGVSVAGSVDIVRYRYYVPQKYKIKTVQNLRLFKIDAVGFANGGF